MSKLPELRIGAIRSLNREFPDVTNYLQSNTIHPIYANMASLRPLRAQGMACSMARTSLRPIQCTTSLKTWPASRTQIRCKSGPYGYTQAKSLVFSEYGEPKDVLK